MVTLLLFLTFCSVTAYNECNPCNWSPWGSCSHRCGGGKQRRTLHDCGHECNSTVKSEVQTCNEICENGIFKSVCICSPGYRGSCCQLPCEDGYYGDRCNSTCTCPKNTKCDTVTGDCLQGANSQRQVTPVRTNLIIGAAVGGFVLVQTFAIVLVFLYKKGQRRTKITEHLDAGKFWPEKSCSNPVLDLSENHYEEIPFDKSQGKAKKISRKNSTEKASNSTQRESFRKGSKKENSFKNKSSMKKESFRKGSKKEDVVGFTRSDMYQFLSENGEDCGYQTLSLDTMKSQAMDNPAMNLYNPGYLSMNGVTNQDTPTTTPEGGYMEMSNQA